MDVSAQCPRAESHPKSTQALTFSSLEPSALHHVLLLKIAISKEPALIAHGLGVRSAGAECDLPLGRRTKELSRPHALVFTKIRGGFDVFRCRRRVCSSGAYIMVHSCVWWHQPYSCHRWLLASDYRFLFSNVMAVTLLIVATDESGMHK